MQSFSPEQKLDMVLNALLQYVKPTDSIVTIQSLTDYFSDKIQPIEIKLIVEKLIKDELAQRTVWMNFEIYNVTFEGFAFIGYEKQRILDNEELIKISKTEKRVEEYETKLYHATLLAGIVAAMLLLWQVLLFYFPNYSQYPYHFWFEKWPQK